MKAFDYSAPRDEAGVLSVLLAEPGQSEILAGGTDLIGLMKKFIVTPDRVVNIKEVRSLRGIDADSEGVTIGAVTNLDDMLESPHLDDFPAVQQAIRNMSSPQLQAQGTLGGDLCQRPRCWFFRNGYGRLAAANLIADGDNRYHAIFGNEGAAKFVSASRLAPALIALGAQVRVIGPGPTDEQFMPLSALFQTPRTELQRETVLEPNQLLTHIRLPRLQTSNATYEVRHGEGPDYPLVAAAAALRIESGVVQQAAIVLGQVAPTPWFSADAVRAIAGRPVTEATAAAAGEAAVASATPLAHNGYKVQLAQVAVKRAILSAASLETGGF